MSDQEQEPILMQTQDLRVWSKKGDKWVEVLEFMHLISYGNELVDELDGTQVPLSGLKLTLRPDLNGGTIDSEVDYEAVTREALTLRILNRE